MRIISVPAKKMNVDTDSFAIFLTETERLRAMDLRRLTPTILAYGVCEKERGTALCIVRCKKPSPVLPYTSLFRLDCFFAFRFWF